jgi:hypothetical protein
VSIRFDGEYQVLTNVHGDIIYPIMLEGTTYLPVRALAGLFDVEIDWDPYTRSVLSGAQPDEPAQPDDTPPDDIPPDDIPPMPTPDGWGPAPGHWGIGLGITDGDVRESGFPRELQEHLREGPFHNAMRFPDSVAGEESSAEFRVNLAYFDGRVDGFAFRWFIGGTTADLAMGSRYRTSIINAADGEVITFFDWDLNSTTIDEPWEDFVTFAVHGFTESIDNIILSFRHLGGATISDIWVYDVYWFVLPDTP